MRLRYHIWIIKARINLWIFKKRIEFIKWTIETIYNGNRVHKPRQQALDSLDELYEAHRIPAEHLISVWKCLILKPDRSN